MRKYHFLSIGMPPISFKLAGNGGFDVAGAIGSGLSFIGGLVTNSTNKKLAREQMAQQERLFNTQMDYTKAAEMRQYEYADKAWDREAAYNDPAAQKARFEAAGLNPALMMEGQNAAIGSAESVSAPSPPSPPSLQSYQVQDPITPAVQTYFQSRMLSAQARKTEEEANQVGIDNRFREVRDLLELENSRQEINKLISSRHLDEMTKNYYITLRDHIEEQLSILQQSHKAMVDQEYERAFVLNQQGHEIIQKVRGLRIDNFFSTLEHQLGIKLSRASIKRISSQIELDKAMTKTEAARYAKEILEASEYVPGSEQWKRKEKEIKAALMSAGRIGFPLGISIPGSGNLDNDSINNPLPPYMRYW